MTTAVYDASRPDRSRLMAQWQIMQPEIFRLMRAAFPPTLYELVPVTAAGPRYEVTGYEDAYYLEQQQIKWGL